MRGRFDIGRILLAKLACRVGGGFEGLEDAGQALTTGAAFGRSGFAGFEGIS
jgi:hypothetical protein